MVAAWRALKMVNGLPLIPDRACRTIGCGACWRLLHRMADALFGEALEAAMLHGWIWIQRTPVGLLFQTRSNLLCITITSIKFSKMPRIEFIFSLIKAS